MKFVSALLIGILCYSKIYAQNDVGELCQVDGESGVCVNIEYCDEALENVKNRRKIQQCGFDGKIPIVCCVTKYLTSLKKCMEYHTVKTNSLFPRPPGVIGGVKSKIEKHPHMVALGFGEDTNIQWLCGGTLISENYVLTAAHCLSSYEFGDVRKVIAGTSDLRNTSNDGVPQIFDVKRKIPHPDYKRPIKYNDIALIELDRHAFFTTFVKPACLHTNTALPQRLIAAGFGKTDSLVKINYELYEVDLITYNNSYCNEFYDKGHTIPKGIVNNQLCAGGKANEEKDTCQGDSGGPLHYKKGRFLYLVGITSFGIACGVIGTPGVYTRVSSYLPWIESIVWG